MSNDPPAEARIIEVGDSNVVIRFLAWIDQREADWWKAQSRAIPAVKTALEDAGFGLPEPIYRLRFDPRSATLPFENIAEGQAAGNGGGRAQPTGQRAGKGPARPLTPGGMTPPG